MSSLADSFDRPVEVMKTVAGVRLRQVDSVGESAQAVAGFSDQFLLGTDQSPQPLGEQAGVKRFLKRLVDA